MRWQPGAIMLALLRRISDRRAVRRAVKAIPAVGSCGRYRVRMPWLPWLSWRPGHPYCTVKLPVALPVIPFKLASARIW